MAPKSRTRSAWCARQDRKSLGVLVPPPPCLGHSWRSLMVVPLLLLLLLLQPVMPCCCRCCMNSCRDTLHNRNSSPRAIRQLLRYRLPRAWLARAAVCMLVNRPSCALLVLVICVGFSNQVKQEPAIVLY